MEVVLYLIGLLLWCLIGGAAAFDNAILFDFAIVIGLWFGIFLVFVTPAWIAMVYGIVYIIVTVGSAWKWIDGGNNHGN